MLLRKKKHGNPKAGLAKTIVLLQGAYTGVAACFVEGMVLCAGTHARKESGSCKLSADDRPCQTISISR